MQMFDMTTLLWVVWVTQSMFCALIYKKSTERWEIHYHVLFPSSFLCFFFWLEIFPLFST